jgi:penicillin-binding protein 1C
VLDPRIAAVLTDILSDDAARSAAFGRDSALSFPFPVAAKTGTSKGYRDNWTVGYTHEVTVAVWVGNFDGTPMTGSTGVTGAGPLFHEVMLAAMRGRAPAPLVRRDGLVEAEVCALSGERPGSACGHRVEELFLPERMPAQPCAFHVRARVDTDNGLLAGAGCADAEPRTFEAYPPRYAAWAAAARRPTLPVRWSPRCGPAPSRAAARQVARIVEPSDGARFLVDPAVPDGQEIVFAATPALDDPRVSFVLDGRTIGVVEAPFELPWRLVPGRHQLEARDALGATSAPITFEVVE